MKRWRDLPVFALADTPRSTDREAITELKAWGVREPDSKRQYTVVRLTNGAGATGYGEGAAASRSEITDAKSIIIGRLPSDAEFVDAAMPNFLVQESRGAVQSGERDVAWQDRQGFPGMRMVHVRYPLPDKPGFGFKINEAALKRYPFKGTVPFSPAFEANGSLASQ
jgi:L-alanine-DL-glutamate epimerase-like enolase superfamily enzyme